MRAHFVKKPSKYNFLINVPHDHMPCAQADMDLLQPVPLSGPEHLLLNLFRISFPNTHDVYVVKICKNYGLSPPPQLSCGI